MNYINIHLWWYRETPPDAIQRVSLKYVNSMVFLFNEFYCNI